MGHRPTDGMGRREHGIRMLVRKVWIH